MRVKAMDREGKTFITDSSDPSLSSDRPLWTEERKAHKIGRIKVLKEKMEHIDMEIDKLEKDGEDLERTKVFDFNGYEIGVQKSALLLCLKLYRDELQIDYDEDTTLVEFDGDIPKKIEDTLQELCRMRLDGWESIVGMETLNSLQRMVDIFFWETLELPIDSSTIGGKVQ